jgi:hypothetical protein
MGLVVISGKTMAEPRKLNPKTNTRVALHEVLDRKKYGLQPDYRGVAKRYGIAPSTLKWYVGMYRCGKLKLGEFDNNETKAVDTKAVLMRKLGAIEIAQRRYSLQIERVARRLGKKEITVEDHEDMNRAVDMSAKLIRLRDMTLKESENLLMIEERQLREEVEKEARAREVLPEPVVAPSEEPAVSAEPDKNEGAFLTE